MPMYPQFMTCASWNMVEMMMVDNSILDNMTTLSFGPTKINGSSSGKHQKSGFGKKIPPQKKSQKNSKIPLSKGKVSGGSVRLWKTAVCSLAVAFLTPKRVQVLGGRWASIAQFRRPLFAVFSDLWRAAVPVAAPWLPGGVPGWSW